MSLESAMRRAYEQTRQDRLNDPKRLAAVYSSRFFNEPKRDQLLEFCSLATTLLRAPISEINLVTANEQINVIAIPPTTNVPADQSYCQNVIATGASICVVDSSHDVFLASIRKTVLQGVRSYLGVPLMTGGNDVLGALCVADYERRDWSTTDIAVLTHLASAVMSFHES